MKRLTPFILALGLFFSVTVSAEQDPKTQNYVQATTSFIGAIGSFASGAALLAQEVVNYSAAIQAASAFVAGAGQVVAGGYNLYNASNMEDSDGSNGGFDSSALGGDGADFTPGTGGFGTGGLRGPASNNDIKNRANGLREEALAKQQQLKQMLQDFFGPDVQIDDVAINPEKYAPAEDVAKLKKEMEKNKEDVDTDAAEDYASSYLASNFGSSGGVFAPSFGKFNMGDFMSRFKRGHSLKGYYGNTSLKWLKPNSKQSLFERVSKTIKKIMKKG